MDLANVTTFFQNMEKQVNNGKLTGVLSHEDAQEAYSKLTKDSPDLIPSEIKEKFGENLDSDLFKSIDPLGMDDGLINDQELYASLDLDPSFKPWTPEDQTDQSSAINGETGPFETTQPDSGNYGRNAALNVQDTPLEDLSQTDIQYTPADKPMRADALGYAEQDIKKFDEDGNGSLSQEETRLAFGGGSDTEIPDTMFSAIDTDGDGQISNQEQAAYVMFQDHSVDPLKSAIKANEEAGLMTPEEALNLEAQIGISAPTDSQADGLITVEERSFADGMILSAPSLVRQVLEGFQDFINKGDVTPDAT